MAKQLLIAFRDFAVVEIKLETFFDAYIYYLYSTTLWDEGQKLNVFVRRI